MADDVEYLKLLRRKAERILAKSPGMEGMPAAEAAPLEPALSGSPRTESASLEAVIRWYRPVLAVADDRFVASPSNAEGDTRFRDPNEAASQALLDALERRRNILDPVIRSVGRIELLNNVRYPWVGTGWILGSDLGSDIIVTNAHVGREFALRSGADFVFRPGVPDISVRQSARIDFREEVGLASAREFPITDIIWISEKPGLDVALLRVGRSAGTDRIDPPIGLLPEVTSENRMLAVIGFPGSNNGYDPDLFRKLFGSVTGNKRFSPGFYTGRRGGSATYDCSTLPGSSGSVVLDVETGRAIGLHFAGTAFDTNFAVPASELSRIIAERPWHGESISAPPRMLGDAPAGAASVGGTSSSNRVDLLPQGLLRSSDGSLTVTLPLEITVRLGSLSTTTGIHLVPTPGLAPAARTDRESAEAAAEKVRRHLTGDKTVLSVKAGFLFREGTITDDFGVIVGVRPGAVTDGTSRGLGNRIDGVEISVETADPTTLAKQLFGVVTEAVGDRTANYDRDLNNPKFNLSPVIDHMTIVLHVSPEAGWPVLKGFLAEDDCDRLTIGMYHMTAPHVVEAIEVIAARRDTRITLTLDRQRGDAKNPDDITGVTKIDDIPETETIEKLEGIAGKRFKWAPASLGAHGLFEKAYNIKVAVWSKSGRGHELQDRAFWLSSGNWQSSNQSPLKISADEIDKVTQSDVQDYNREWHAVVRHQGLASTFRHHLEQDYEDNAAAAAEEAPMPVMFDILVPPDMIAEAPRAREFKAFAPEVIEGRIKVQPLLTPDNYPEVVADLISKAKDRVLIQNQSFSFWSEMDDTPEHFLKIANAVKDRQKKGLDVRIIFRSGYGKEREVLRQLKQFGIKADGDRVRYFDKCHTKGIIIDDEIAILGSQNWTGAGTGPNRDASLVIWHPKANQYFARLFEYDWCQLARNRVRADEAMQPVQLVPAGSEVPTPPGYRRISLAEFLGET